MQHKQYIWIQCQLSDRSAYTVFFFFKPERHTGNHAASLISITHNLLGSSNQLLQTLGLCDVVVIWISVWSCFEFVAMMSSFFADPQP